MPLQPLRCYICSVVAAVAARLVGMFEKFFTLYFTWIRIEYAKVEYPVSKGVENNPPFICMSVGLVDPLVKTIIC